MVHARIPVHDADLDDIVGVVYRRDVLAAEPEQLKPGLPGVTWVRLDRDAEWPEHLR